MTAIEKVIALAKSEVGYAVLGEVNWIAVASASALAGVLSVLTSVAGLPECKEE